jgi:uncharacterized membrane protein
VAERRWLSLLDGLGLGDTPWAARSLSMVFSLAVLPLAYLAGRRLGGSRRHGEVALVLFAANPWSVRYAGEAVDIWARTGQLAALEALADHIEAAPPKGGAA